MIFNSHKFRKISTDRVAGGGSSLPCFPSDDNGSKVRRGSLFVHSNSIHNERPKTMTKTAIIEAVSGIAILATIAGVFALVMIAEGIW